METGFLGILVHLLVQSVLLMVAMAVAGGAGKRHNTWGRALGASALLSLASTVVMAVGSAILLVFLPFVALFILRSLYEIGWLRALLVSIVLFVVWLLAAIFIYAPLALLSSAFTSVFGIS